MTMVRDWFAVVVWRRGRAAALAALRWFRFT